MAIPRSMGWLVVTGAVVLGLVGLSFLALDRPNVVWVAQRPQCPQCRTEVRKFSHRCPTCREEFDWVIAADEDSPWCTSCLSPTEDETLRQRKVALGEEEATKRVVVALHLPQEAARAYLHDVGRGQCGWCGGTGRDLSAAEKDKAPCPVCFGEKRCIACDGDRRVRLGVELAARELDHYVSLARMLSTPSTADEGARREILRANQQFLRRFAGTEEAAGLFFSPLFVTGSEGTSAGIPRGVVLEKLPRGVDMAHDRLQEVLTALGAR